MISHMLSTLQAISVLIMEPHLVLKVDHDVFGTDAGREAPENDKHNFRYLATESCSQMLQVLLSSSGA